MRWSWILTMAWRDSRKNRSRLLLFISSIVLGIAALVAMKSFNENLSRNIDEQAAQLLGADLSLESRRIPNEEILAFIDSIKSLSIGHAREEQFMSMITFAKNGGSRLIQVRAISGDYPLYGRLSTEPAQADKQFGSKPQVLVDNSLIVQYDAAIGDSVQLGLSSFEILGNLLIQPGQSAISGSFVPSVWVPLQHLEGSGLQQTGSRIEYLYYFKFPPSFPVDQLVESLEDRLQELQIRSETIASTKRDTARSFEDMARFMELVSFIALLLGCIGVSSAVHIYMREKLTSVAILRCLGASAKQIIFIFLVQFIAIGLVGGVLGAFLGSFIQFAVPLALQEFVPVTLHSQLSWAAISQGIALGALISVLFTLLPLLSVRNISPLNSLRVGDENQAGQKDKFRWVVYFGIGIFIVGFAYLQLNEWIMTLSFSLAVGCLFLFFYATARLFTYLIRRFFPKRWPYLWKQGLANLYRPNNQTIVLLVALGMGTALVSTLYFVQDMLLQRVQIEASDQQANMLMFDIQPSQLEPLKDVTREAGLPIIEEVPVVTVQITAINDQTVSELMKDSTRQRSARSLNREIRATFRSQMTDAEKVVDGVWIGQVSPGDTAQVSLETGYASRLGVDIGDVLQFSVHGVSIPAIVSSTREVNWAQFQTNFRLSFAEGSIDQAPRFYVLMTRTEDLRESTDFQQRLLAQFPSVSVVDLHKVLEILTELMKKISFVIQFLGSFSILTGIVVLIASVRISKYQRIRENVLLRTLGASRKQVLVINMSEYLILGTLAAALGLLAATLACSLLGSFVFEMTFVPSIGKSLVILVIAAVITTLIGILNARSTLNHSPLGILRKV